MTVKPRRNVPTSYIVAARAPGESIDTGGWANDSRVLVLRGNPTRDLLNVDRFLLFERVFVERDAPRSVALGPNGCGVELFLSELARRGGVDSVDLPPRAWVECHTFLQRQQHDPNADALSRAAWDAAYVLAKGVGAIASCNAASDIAKDMAMRAAHISEPADARDSASPGSAEWQDADLTITIRVVGFEMDSPIYRGEGINVGAALTAERAALAVVMQRQLAPELFAALTEPMRRFVDASLFGVCE